MAEFKATTFDELFEGIKHIPWAEDIPRDAKFWVTKATTNKSKLSSGPLYSPLRRRLWSKG